MSRWSGWVRLFPRLLSLSAYTSHRLAVLFALSTHYPCVRPRDPAPTPNMAQVLQGGDGGMMGGFPLEQWFYEMPVCTRWWMTAALSASVLVQCHIISPFQLFYSVRAVFFRSQVHSHMFYVATYTDASVVLAPGNDLLLLRSPLPRSALPHLLPPTLLAPP